MLALVRYLMNKLLPAGNQEAGGNSGQTSIYTLVGMASDDRQAYRGQEGRRAGTAANSPSAWYIVITWGLVLNFALLTANSYLVTRIDDWYAGGPARKRYELTAWLGIFAVIFLVGGVTTTLLILYWESPKGWKLWKYRDLKRFRPLINLGAPRIGVLAVELLCFLLVVLYIRKSALPTYATIKWEREAEYIATPGLPAVAVFAEYNDDAVASFSDLPTKCYFPSYLNESCSQQFISQTQPIPVGTYGNLVFHKFTPTGDMKYNHLSNKLLLNTFILWNSNKIMQSYKTNAPQNPYLFVVLYDPQIDLINALNCSYLSLTEIPALGSNTFSITATRIEDPLGMIKLDSADKNCQNFPSSYTTYSSTIASTGTSYSSVCDYGAHSSTSNSTDPCISQTIVRYENFVQSKMTSVHKIKKVEIWLNEAAIVGAVQFVAWYFGIYDVGRNA